MIRNRGQLKQNKHNCGEQLQWAFLDIRHLFHTGNKEQEEQACASYGGASEQQLGHGSNGTMEVVQSAVGFLLSGGLATDAINPKYHITQAVWSKYTLGITVVVKPKTTDCSQIIPWHKKGVLRKRPLHFFFWRGRKGSEKTCKRSPENAL